MTDNSTPASRLLIADAAELNRLAAAFPVWQPIATAPLDRHVLLYVDPSCGYIIGFFAAGHWRDGFRPLSEYGRPPQFWMPLPPDPEPTT